MGGSINEAPLLLPSSSNSSSFQHPSSCKRPSLTKSYHLYHTTQTGALSHVNLTGEVCTTRPLSLLSRVGLQRTCRGLSHSAMSTHTSVYRGGAKDSARQRSRRRERIVYSSLGGHTCAHLPHPSNRLKIKDEVHRCSIRCVCRSSGRDECCAYRRVRCGHSRRCGRWNACYGLLGEARRRGS